MFKNIREGIRHWFLNNALKNLKRKKRIFSYKDALRFGILYDASTEENYRQITLLVKELQQDQKKVKTLGFVAQKKMPDYCFPKLTFEFCNKGYFGWNQQPVAPNVKEFIAADYDVIIDLTPSVVFHAKFLTSLSNVPFKVGRYHEKYVDLYDLMIQIDDNSSLEDAAKHTMYYLKMLNNDRSDD